MSSFYITCDVITGCNSLTTCKQFLKKYEEVEQSHDMHPFWYFILTDTTVKLKVLENNTNFNRFV